MTYEKVKDKLSLYGVNEKIFDRVVSQIEDLKECVLDSNISFIYIGDDVKPVKFYICDAIDKLNLTVGHKEIPLDIKNDVLKEAVSPVVNCGWLYTIKEKYHHFDDLLYYLFFLDVLEKRIRLYFYHEHVLGYTSKLVKNDKNSPKILNFIQFSKLSEDDINNHLQHFLREIKDWVQNLGEEEFKDLKEAFHELSTIPKCKTASEIRNEIIKWDCLVKLEDLHRTIDLFFTEIVKLDEFKTRALNMLDNNVRTSSD